MAQSARGLFRATGKRPRPVALRRDDGKIVKAENLPRAEHEFLATPPEATRALLAAEAHNLFGVSTRRRVWEPAAGDGAMVRVLREAGLDVVASDLVDRGCGAEIRDFFAYTSAPAPIIVTNPPFAAVNWRDGRARWISHARETLGIETMALLLPWSWPAAAGLDAVWGLHPPNRALLMTWKIDFTGQGAQPANHGWFIWYRSNLNGSTLMRRIGRVDDRQAVML